MMLREPGLLTLICLENKICIVEKLKVKTSEEENHHLQISIYKKTMAQIRTEVN